MSTWEVITFHLKVSWLAIWDAFGVYRLDDQFGCLFALVIGLITQSLVHESGHVVLGLLSGVRPRLFAIGTKVRLWPTHRYFYLVPLGGEVRVCEEQLMGPDGPRVWAIICMAAGGTLFNLASVTLVFGMACIGYITFAVAVAFAVFPGAAAMVNLWPFWPFSLNGRANDGTIIRKPAEWLISALATDDERNRIEPEVKHWVLWRKKSRFEK